MIGVVAGKIRASTEFGLTGTASAHSLVGVTKVNQHRRTPSWAILAKRRTVRLS